MIDSATQVWNTCGYVRLSREDGDKEESNSVTGQKDEGGRRLYGVEF